MSTLDSRLITLICVKEVMMVGRRDSSEYVYIEAILSWDHRRREARLNPAPNQTYPEYMYIECSKEIRELPLGSRIKLKVVEKNPKTEYHDKHLYSYYRWRYEIISIGE